MKHARIGKRIAALFISLVLALQVTLPSVAFAEQRSVELDNHTTQSDQTTLISDIVIGGVEKPIAGTALDEKATVTAAGDVSWEIPVLWVRDDLQMGAGQAEEGHAYLPSLAFFVPQGYALADGAFSVTLSDSLTELFGTQEVISVYAEATGITYIIPVSLKDLFAQRRADDAQNNANTASQDAAVQEQARDDDEGEEEDDEDAADGCGDGMTPVEIHCAMTARDALTDDDLQWLVELITDYLEPQAINLLFYNFGGFNEAAKKGEIGKEMSLYIYYQAGDNDGNPEHAGIKGALAYVSADAHQVDGVLKYCYMLAMDVDSLVKKDANNKPIRDPNTGKYTLVREGKPLEILKNTIVHEMFHALMDDYNRTGMSGGTNLEDLITDSAGHFPTQELGNRYVALQYPQWFIEGTASAVEGVYQFRYDTFQNLRRLPGKDGKFGTGDLGPTFAAQQLIDNYIDGCDVDGEFRYYDLKYAVGGKDDDGKEIETEASRYVMGYLATLYLCDLTSRYHQSNKGSSVKVVDGVTTVDSDQLRVGLNSLLTWMHEGSTMDSLINALSPRKEDGTPIYKDTATFQDLFIKGPKAANGTYEGDGESQAFVGALLNYLLYLDNNLPDEEHPNGSILEDFSKRYTSLLDENKKTSSDYLKIINSNDMIPSTVKSDTPNIGGGRTNPDEAKVKAAAVAASTSSTAGLAGQQETPLPIAAKTSNAREPEKQEQQHVDSLPASTTATVVSADGQAAQQKDLLPSAINADEACEAETQTEQQGVPSPAEANADGAFDTTPIEQGEPEIADEKPAEAADNPATESVEG